MLVTMKRHPQHSATSQIDVEAMYMERLKRAIKATNATGKPSPTAKGKRRSGTPAEATADYKRHAFMKDFRADIRAFLPDTTDQADDDEDDDDMVVVAGGRETYICPLSRKLLEDPVTSTLCHHSYSRAAVEQMLRQRRLAQCPISGRSVSSGYSFARDYVRILITHVSKRTVAHIQQAATNRCLCATSGPIASSNVPLFATCIRNHSVTQLRTMSWKLVEVVIAMRSGTTMAMTTGT